MGDGLRSLRWRAAVGLHGVGLVFTWVWMAGGNFVTRFEVEPGTHVVTVLREGCEGVPDTVELGGEHGRRATFIADVDDGFRCRVILR